MEDDLYATAKSVAQAEDCSVSAAVNKLLRQRIEVVQVRRKDTGLPVSAGRRPIRAAEVGRPLAGTP
ncbi:MAG: hypothetical protein H7343_23190 [Undibacterium sp.]|nr:hypothetical protein [Opitutaceae bacterium]